MRIRCLEEKWAPAWRKERRGELADDPARDVTYLREVGKALHVRNGRWVDRDLATISLVARERGEAFAVNLCEGGLHLRVVLMDDHLTSAL